MHTTLITAAAPPVATAPVIVCCDDRDGVAAAQLLTEARLAGLSVLRLDIARGQLLADNEIGLPLPAPPQTALAVIAPASLLPAAEAWRSSVMLDAPVLQLDANIAALLRAAATRASAAARVAAEASARLAALRATHETLQNGYALLRDVVQDHGLNTPVCAFHAPPADDPPAVAANASRLRQALPRAFRSLAAIGLHVARAPTGSGTVTVVLASATETADPIVWRVAFDALRPGWVHFALDAPPLHSLSTPVLSLSFATISGEPPAFSLTWPQPRADHHASGAHGSLGRGLALRLFSGIAGTPLAVSAEIWPAFLPDDRRTTALELLPAQFEDMVVEDARGLSRGMDWLPVRKLRARRTILVHPLGAGRPTIGRIPLSLPRGTQEVHADVRTENPQAGPVRFGLAVEWREAEDGTHEFGDSAVWTTLPAETPGSLNLRLPEPLERPADLYLMTEVPPGHSSNFCWAHFLRLTAMGELVP